ncbi:fungal-specific transcription factor domain-containing protein [Chaetomium tenue]|uniref:Fungal-specific transcription factor domain-containing protein n=1 Tax=Chaetomium tenue TaxID=1854479 RepID=A0ACB7NXX0_9PEZI|nr:fungal-specific transcription factor domain-containing protein [Chaetomium globosum]
MASERRNDRGDRQRRRKIPLACEPCRERKSRCDGAKPICSTCQRRSLPLHSCVYTLDNARTASNDAYIKVLHDRIRLLEKTCTDHGVPIPPFESGDPEDGAVPPNRSPVSPPLPGQQQRSEPGLPVRSPAQGLREHASSPALRPPIPVTSPDHDRLDATESTASVTAMGTVTTEDDVCETFNGANEFYGSSSAASFMKEAYTSVKPHQTRYPGTNTARGQALSMNFARPEPLYTPQFAQADKFALPPRNLADHLLNRFWERVYWLHPLFDKDTFMRAYETLWQPAHEQPTMAALPGLGLGSTPGADAGTIVFHCALNTIFALGAQFSDLSLKDKASAIETFFNRSKAFVGLDFIDMNNVGVVQSLLLMALLLQSTPFPNRCWNAVGLACRVAQGLGLHTDSGKTNRPQLETEIRRRTWHGCVILDMIVSMTYGRPTMTAHLPDLPVPSTAGFAESLTPAQPQAGGGEVPSKLSYYVEYIRQCRILGEILSNVYQPSAGTPASGPQPWPDQKPHGMDAILELDAKLSRYEAALPPIMSWMSPCDISNLDEDRRSVITAQRTVLRGSFLYLRLMLHRPILTQLCAEAGANPSAEPNSPMRPGAVSAGQELFTSFAAGCAKICLGSAVDLIELIHNTYLTKATGGWWWDGLYAFTAGLAVIVGYLSPTLLASLDKQRLERSWMLCQKILAHFTSFSISAQRSLRVLQKVHADVMSRSTAVLDKDQELPLQPPTLSAATACGETPGPGQQAAAMQPDDAPLDLGNHFQWTSPAGNSEMFGAGLVFNWDQSLDMLSGGLGMDLYQ